jgi:hypothetical protein
MQLVNDDRDFGYLTWQRFATNTFLKRDASDLDSFRRNHPEL